MNNNNTFFNNFQKINNQIDIVIKKHLNVENNNNKNNNSIKILDIGSSNGYNSTKQIDWLVEKIRKQLPNKIIEVYYSDLPQNDFTLLFNTINNSNSSRSVGGPSNQQIMMMSNVIHQKLLFSYAIGNDYENQLLPFESVDFIMSFNSFHWVPLEKHYYSYQGSFANLINPMNRQKLCENNLNYFKVRLFNVLKLHLLELKSTGSVFNCNFLIYDNNSSNCPTGVLSMEDAFLNVKNVIRSIGNKVDHQGNSLLSKDEIEKMVLPVIMYTKDEYEWVINNITSEFGPSLTICKSKSKFSWKDISSGSSNSPPADQKQDNSSTTISPLIETILTYCGMFIKNAINGDQFRKESIYNDFKFKLNQEFKLNPSKFEFDLSFLFLSFSKE